LLNKIVDTTKIDVLDFNNLEETVNYMFIYCSSKMPYINKSEITLAEIEEQDISYGIYHAKMGTDSGIVKKIVFKKSDIPYQREVAARESGESMGTSIKQVFNADVTLFGNNIYYPGDYIYINPIYAFGYGTNSGQILDLQSSLGIGGYYMVLKVNTNIGESGFETKLECVYQASLQSVKDKKYRRVDTYQKCAPVR